MNQYSTLHDVKKISVRSGALCDSESNWTTRLEFADGKGHKVEITLFSDSPLVIEGADHVNHVAQPQEVVW